MSRWRPKHPLEPREEWCSKCVRSSWQQGWWRPGSRRGSRPGSVWPPEEDIPAAATRRWRNDATQQEGHSGKLYPMLDFVLCIYVYFKCGKLPSMECAQVVLASLGLAPLWVKAAELASYLPSHLWCSHSLASAHNTSSMCFQSGETQQIKGSFLAH